MSAKRVFALVSLVFVVSCAAQQPQPRKGPRIELLAPADFLTNDLDFVIRIDTRRLRGEPAIDLAARGLAKGEGSGVLGTILPALEGARAIFVGGRILSDGFHGDGVIAIEPVSSAEIEAKPLDASFRRVRNAPSHVAIFERGTSARDQASLEIVLEGGGVVLATPAEMDAVLRVIRSGPDIDRFDPPARGLASFAGRMPPAIPDASPSAASSSTFRRIAQGLARYSGSVEGGDALHAEIELVYATPDEAADAAASARSLLTRLGAASDPLRSLADSVELAREEKVVRVRAAVPFAVMAKLH